MPDQLAKVKLLITDYSSVCYNSFYRGAGVVFYQSDLDKYEELNGKLIPNDSEYIGFRCYNTHELKNHIKNGISNGSINISYYRRKEFIENYKLINEFSDGNNIERIYLELIKRKII